MTVERHHSDLCAAAYRTSRENIIRLVREHPEGTGLPVRACPGWSVRDLVGHLLQVCRMVLAEAPGEISEPPAPEAGTLLPALVDAWTDLDGGLPEVLRRAPGLRARIMVLDVLSHELDIRQTLEIPVPHEHGAFSDALDLAIMGFTLSVATHDLPALRIETPEREWLAGSGEPAGTVRAGSLDLFRSLTGRRTTSQIRELSWSDAPDAWLPAFVWGPFAPPENRVEETAGD